MLGMLGKVCLRLRIIFPAGPIISLFNNNSEYRYQYTLRKSLFFLKEFLTNYLNDKKKLIVYVFTRSSIAGAVLQTYLPLSPSVSQ